MWKVSTMVGALALAAGLGINGVAQAAESATRAVNDVIEIVNDGKEGYQTAAKAVSNPQLKTLFGDYARQREEFAKELQNEVAGFGESPEKSGTAPGTGHRGWMNLKAAVTKGDDAILDEVVRGEETAVKTYEDALKQDLSEETKALLTKQKAEIQQALNEVRERKSQAS